MGARRLTLVVMLTTAACSGNDTKPGSTVRLDISMTMGSNADHLVDPNPTTKFVGDQLKTVSTVTTAEGNQFIVQFSATAVPSPGRFMIGLGTPVQAGFSVQGTSGTVLYESGSMVVSDVDWASTSGHVIATLSGLHRAADSLGVAPESSAQGSIDLVVPAH